MGKVATDIYSIRELRENGFTYVDKMAMLLPLADLPVGKQFFLARLTSPSLLKSVRSSVLLGLVK